jgi:hypothetical protein
MTKVSLSQLRYDIAQSVSLLSFCLGAVAAIHRDVALYGTCCVICMFCWYTLVATD